MTALPTPGGAERDWWSSLTHGGLLIAPARIAEFFGADIEPLPWRLEERLRRDVTRVRQDEKYIGPFLDTLLEHVLGLAVTVKEAAVEKQWSRKLLTGESYRPSRLWLGKHDDVFPIFIIRARGEASTPRLGVGRGRREVSKVTEWLRLSGQPVGLLTNGRQFRLIHAGADYSAWCEWDVDQWLEGGFSGLQVEAFRRLLSVEALAASAKGARSRLVEAILASRRGQAQLSAALGERVRQAVETLIRASGHAIDPLLAENAKVVHRRMESLNKGLQSLKHGAVAPSDVYIAATRIVMRLVVVLFAEARDLLPRDNPLYHRSYGLQGLRDELARAAGGRAERLRHRFSSWPRLLGLFRLVATGSGHEELPIPAYGGGLFELGLADSADAVSRALAAFESADNILTDETVRTIIDLLTRSPVKVRQGRGSTTVMSPVDFSDLSSEYLGILYEGLLDFELKRVPDGDTFVFLNVGDEPVLPLSRLEKMDEKALKSLFEKLKAKPPSDDIDSTDEEDDDADAGADDLEPGSDNAEGSEVPGSDQDDLHRESKQRVSKWAKKAVVAAGLVKTRRGREPDVADLEAAQETLVRRVLVPGEWFLVRWGGTRKGAGTFYTRPQLTGPTVRGALQALAYNPTKQLPDSQWEPRKPEEILSLRVCDPAMGSGSFLVAALRYLTQALLESLYFHGRLETNDAQTLCRLADGALSNGIAEELLPIPSSHPDFEARLRARLKRHVVEACIYGIDIDPMAVELARLALWIETMDRTLPFEFLDHKLRTGNGLVGGWLDNCVRYPTAAWDRTGGDAKHDNFVHHHHAPTSSRTKNSGDGRRGDKWTALIKERKTRFVVPRAEKTAGGLIQTTWLTAGDRDKALTLVKALRSSLGELARIPLHEAGRRAKYFNDKVLSHPARAELKRTLDCWCSLWFWPCDRLNLAPLPGEMATLSEEAASIVAQVSERERFFHWEIEFPEVFTTSSSGFDALVGNPPWDTIQPESLEFFSDLDPLFRALDDDEADDRAEELFTDSAETETQWILYRYRFDCISNWLKQSDTATPRRYALQGKGKLHTYRAFLERTLRLASQTQAHLGLVLPSSFYSDSGSAEMRRTLFTEGRVAEVLILKNTGQWLFDMESRYRVVTVTLNQPRDKTDFGLRVALDARSIEAALSAPRLAMDAPTVAALSPESWRLLELQRPAELSLAKKITLGLRGSSRPHYLDSFSREFNVSTKGKFLKAGSVPVLDGKSIGQYNAYFSRATLFATKKVIEEHRPGDAAWRWKTVFREVARGDDARTIISCVLPPKTTHTYNLCSFLFDSFDDAACVSAVANTYIFDWFARRVVDKHTSTIYTDLPWPTPEALHRLWPILRGPASRLMGDLVTRKKPETDTRSRFLAASDVDVLVARFLGLTSEEFAVVLSDFRSRFTRAEDEREYLSGLLAGSPAAPAAGKYEGYEIDDQALEIVRNAQGS